jgi:DNA-binding response OmpR family regulator
MARILIVEDNRVIGDLLTLAIECLGYDVTLATSGAEALDLLAKFNHEVVFADIYMEPMSGMDFITKVKELHPHTVFAFMSGDIDPDLEDRGMEMGALAFVHKPVNIEEFQKVLKRALRRVERQHSGKTTSTPAPKPARNPAEPALPSVERLLLVAGDEVIRDTIFASLTAKGIEVIAVADGLAAVAALLMSQRPFAAAVVVPPLAVLEADELGAQLLRLEPRLRLGLLTERKTKGAMTPFHVVAPAFRNCEDVENVFGELVHAVAERPAA